MRRHPVDERGAARTRELEAAGSQVVSVHQGHQSEVEITGDTTALAVWAMSDRWKIQSLRITGLRVEGRPGQPSSSTPPFDRIHGTAHPRS